MKPPRNYPSIEDLTGHLADQIVRLQGAISMLNSMSVLHTGKQPPYVEMYGRLLLENAIDIIPIRPRTKIPAVDGWRQMRLRSRARKFVHLKKYLGHSIGVDTTIIPACDIDCDDPTLVAALRWEINNRYAGPPERLGRSPRTAFLFRASVPFKKMRSSIWLNDEDEEQKLEFLGEGQQIVAYGYHPDTAVPYTWSRNGEPFGLTRIHYDELPLIDEQQAADWCGRFDELAAKRGWRRRSHPPLIRVSSFTNPLIREKLPISLEVFAQAVMQVPGFDGYDTWLRVGMAIYHQSGGSEEGLELWVLWSIQSEKFDEDECRAKWPSFEDNGHAAPVTGRTVYHMAGLSSPVDQIVSGLGLSEDTVAMAFALKHDEDLRFDHSLHKWFHFTGSRWQIEVTELAFDYCRKLCREFGQKAADRKAALALSRAGAVAAVERLAKADRHFAVTSDIWDKDPFFLATPGGTVDLRTGLMRSPVRSDFLTMCTAVTPLARVDPEVDMPVFNQFISEVTSGDTALIRYLQMWGGYCLTGDTREQVLLFIHGPGRNGKSLFQSQLAGMLGDYAWSAPPEMFLSAKHDRHPTELAALRGKRLVVASENENGRAWAEVRIKQLTGGDRLSARLMRQDFFNFDPVAKYLFVGNNKPALTHVDEAMQRRFHILEFLFRPETPDKTLSARLRSEWPAILRWFIDGCMDWQANGFVLPVALRRATDEYFAEQDKVQEWLDERCDVGQKCTDSNDRIRESFADFAHLRGTGAEFDILGELRKRGFETFKNRFGIRGRGLLGLSIRNANEWEN